MIKPSRDGPLLQLCKTFDTSRVTSFITSTPHLNKEDYIQSLVFCIQRFQNEILQLLIHSGVLKKILINAKPPFTEAVVSRNVPALNMLFDSIPDYKNDESAMGELLQMALQKPDAEKVCQLLFDRGATITNNIIQDKLIMTQCDIILIPKLIEKGLQFINQGYTYALLKRVLDANRYDIFEMIYFHAKSIDMYFRASINFRLHIWVSLLREHVEHTEFLFYIWKKDDRPKHPVILNGEAEPCELTIGMFCFYSVTKTIPIYKEIEKLPALLDHPNYFLEENHYGINAYGFAIASDIDIRHITWDVSDEKTCPPSSRGYQLMHLAQSPTMVRYLAKNGASLFCGFGPTSLGLHPWEHKVFVAIHHLEDPAVMYPNWPDCEFKPASWHIALLSAFIRIGMATKLSIHGKNAYTVLDRVFRENNDGVFNCIRNDSPIDLDTADLQELNEHFFKLSRKVAFQYRFDDVLSSRVINIVYDQLNMVYEGIANNPVYQSAKSLPFEIMDRILRAKLYGLSRIYPIQTLNDDISHFVSQLYSVPTPHYRVPKATVCMA